VTACSAFFLYFRSLSPIGLTMEINFAHDVDNVLKQASQLNKPVLLDFSAAPM